MKKRIITLLITFLISQTLFGNFEKLNSYQAFLKKAQSGEKIRVCYLGGSITVGAATAPRQGTNRDGKPFDYTNYDVQKDSWRALTYEWLRKNFESKNGQFEHINVAIGATTSELAAFRLKKHVLAYRPDFLFIEFAVNDAGKGMISAESPRFDRSIQRTMTNIIQRVRNQNSDIAIFIPTSTIRENRISRKKHWISMQKKSVAAHHRIAELLRLPYIDIKTVFYEDPLSEGLERDRLFDGDENAGNFVHPSPQGHKAYAQGVINLLDRIFKTGGFDFKELYSSLGIDVVQALLEQAKALPWSVVWEEFCQRNQVPGELSLLDTVKGYESSVLSGRQ